MRTALVPGRRGDHGLVLAGRYPAVPKVITILWEGASDSNASSMVSMVVAKNVPSAKHVQVRARACFCTPMCPSEVQSTPSLHQ